MLKDFDDNCLQTIMNHTKTNLRKKADGGKKQMRMLNLRNNLNNEIILLFK